MANLRGKGENWLSRLLVFTRLVTRMRARNWSNHIYWRQLILSLNGLDCDLAIACLQVTTTDINCNERIGQRRHGVRYSQWKELLNSSASAVCYAGRRDRAVLALRASVCVQACLYQSLLVLIGSSVSVCVQPIYTRPCSFLFAGA